MAFCNTRSIEYKNRLESAVTASENSKILIVEDDRSLRENLRYNLIAEGYDVLAVADGGDGLSAALNQHPDLVLLDLMIPGVNGVEVCKTLRRNGSIVPILMLTAMDSESSLIEGLESGADDYITKPFSMAELSARIATQLRRMKSIDQTIENGTDERIEFGDLTIDLASRIVKMFDIPIETSLREFELLVFLASNQGRVFTREQLLHSVWGIEYAGNTRTVDVHIRWLRKKIELDPSNPDYLITMRGVGYRMDPFSSEVDLS